MKVKPIKIKQRDTKDCGAACLASIAAYHKLKLSVSYIRQLTFTNKRGTNVLGLIDAASNIGFDAKGVRATFETLKEIPTPAIAHVTLKESLHHFVVIYKVTSSYVEVMDPADGAMHRYTYERFKEMWSGVLVVMWPNQSFQPGDRTTSVMSKFISLVYPHKAVMLQTLVGALFYTVLGLATSIYVQKIVDHVLVDGNRNLLNLMSMVMIAILILQIFIGSIRTIFTMRTGQMIDTHLILGYYKHLLKLPQQFFDTMRVGEIVSRMNDAVKIRSFINEVSTGLAVNIFIIIFSFALMFTYYWKLALVMFVVVPAYAVVYVIANRLNKKVERKVMEDSAELESQLVESLNSMGTIKSFGIEGHMNMKTEIRFVSLLKSVYKSGLNGVFASNSTEFLSRLLVISLLWIGSGFVLERQITAGELLSFYALIGYFNGPIGSLIGMNKVIQNAFIAADRLFEIMDMEREKQENSVVLEREMVGDIQFKDLSFRYGTHVTVFDSFNLTIPKGKLTAIVGESGCGKSTLVSILQNLYPIQSGNVMIGDYSLQYIDNGSLRSLVGAVPQKIDLFAGNVIENIAVGDYTPDLQRIIGICSGLGIMEFIEKLPGGFKTYLGENGVTLSGGQRQRLAVARALYKDPEILILDEATSSLDSHAEQYVQKMINVMKEKHKTVIIIAHRLSTVCQADKIVVIDKGRVVEEGRHVQLMKNRSHYFSLWKQQFPMLEEVMPVNGIVSKEMIS